MTTARLSQLQKRILRWLLMDHQRTQGVIASSHQALVRALQGDKGNSSQSLRTLEVRGVMVMGRSLGGKAEYLRLTPEGRKLASQCAGRCDEERKNIEIRSYGVCNSLSITRTPLSSEDSSKIASEL